MSQVIISGPVAFLEGSSSAVYFSESSAAAGAAPTPQGTAAPVKAIQNNLKIAPWGEDNRFPQNIENQLAYCGVAKAALDWKARALFGGGIIPGRIKGYEDGGKAEIFEPLDRAKEKAIYDWLEQRSLYRFFLEYFQDWVWFGNCFPELIFSKDCKQITGIVQQESSDCRFAQMDSQGRMQHVFISKLWGMAAQQYARFDPEKKLRGLTENPTDSANQELVAEFIKKVPCIDMYDALKSTHDILEVQKGKSDLISAIFPTNYPSPGKTYYQVPAWDGARLAGWIEIASKVPSLIKRLYNKAFRIRYHIELPETYFEKKFGRQKWVQMTPEEQQKEKMDLLKQMDDFLSGSEKAFTSFVSFFEVHNTHPEKEYGRIKITPIEDKTNLDKELITSSAADIQTLIAMQVNPTLFGAGTIGTGQQRSGGSDIREAWLTYNANLTLERNVLLEPLYLVRDFNGWDKDIVFRIRDTVLTTLDKGKGTEKVIS